MRGCGAAVAALLVLASGAPAAAQPSWGDRLADRDVALSDMGAAAGVWSDRDTVWVSDWSGSAVRAYALRGGARRAALDMAELPARNAAGLWSDGDTLWVADFDSDGVDARRLATGSPVEGSLAGLRDAGNDGLTGIWSDGTTLWAADFYDRKAYAYVLSDGTRAASRDVALAGTKRPFGLWSDGATLLAADWTGGRVLAYRLSDGARLASRDIDTSAAGNAKPMGLWSDGETLWVTDEQDDRLYAYAVPGLLEVPLPIAADPSLASLSLSGVDFGTFDAGKTSYAAEVANDVATTTVTAVATRSGATVAIMPADAQTPEHQVALAVGRTVVQVAVTAANGATRRTYAVTVTRAGSSDAALASLSLTGVDIGAFSAERLDYAGRVAYATDSTTVEATTTHGAATVAVSPGDADDRAPGHQVALAVGETAVEVRVTAQDGTTLRTYTATVSRAAPSTDAALRSLRLSGIDLGVFDPDDLSYAASVEYDALSTTTVTAAARTATATVAVSPADADGEAPGHQVLLAVGETVVEVRVTAQDGTTARTYAATVARAPPSTDAALSSLRLSGVDIGTFDPEGLAYTGSVDVGVSSTAVTAEARSALATVAVSPADADAQAAGHQVSLAAGATVVEVRVTAQDATTQRTYAVTVERPTPSTDAALRSLRLSGVDIGTFDPEGLAYTGSVDIGVSSTAVTAEARDTAATVAVSPADADEQAPGHQVRLAVGENVVEVQVTAQDGTTARLYTVAVGRGRHDAALSSLDLSGIDLGTFDPDDLAYAASVDYDALSTTTVTAAARDTAATVAVSPADVDAGAAGHQARLAVGRNVLEVRVTAQDGITARTYTATVVRARPHDEQPVASLAVGDDDRVRIRVPSATDRYHVLYYRPDADDPATEYAVAIHAGGELDVELTEPLRAGAGGAYRVATYLNSAPGDADGDGVDDLAELALSEPGDRAPLNRVTVVPARHGAVALPDMEAFRRLSYQGPDIVTDEHLRDVEHVNFIVANVFRHSEAVYFMDTNEWPVHAVWAHRVLGWDESFAYHWRQMRGEIVYQPHVVAPSGEPGTFRYQFNPEYHYPVRYVARVHRLLAANMPFLRNNLVYSPMPVAVPLYYEEKASYDAARIAVYLESDLSGGSVFGVLNAGVGYGLLRVLESGARPTFRDVVVLRRLPNELSTVAGVISLQRQTPLSHVNLRAVQSGVPNAYVGNALDDPMVAGLVGKYVRYEVAEDPGELFSWTNPATGAVEERAGYVLTEATAEQVAAHHEARRPTEAQTPPRDLTVTTYRALGSVAFADADAFGVKAANLATLRTFGLTDVEVPDGYALPFHYYDAFMTHNGFYDDVDDLLEDEDFTGGIAVRDRELRKLRRRIENGAMPEWMTTSLGTLQGLLAEGVPTRCRSSTNNEDLPGFSGAGLYDSVTHRPGEGHLSKSIKQVFASLWNLRAFEEREFHRIDHKAAAMGVLLHPNFDAELANGVAVSDDPVYGTEGAYYVNAQVGEDLVTNPSSAAVAEELLLTPAEDGGDGEYAEALVQRSNLVADDARVLDADHVATLYAALGTIHARFAALYGIGEDAEFAMEIEFKVTAADALAVKQARPWVY